MFVAEKKVAVAKKKILDNCNCNYKGCSQCLKKIKFIDELALSNIPVVYWFLKMSSFTGSEIIKKNTNYFIENIVSNYENGIGISYLGQYGTGKTFSICTILKYALVNNFSTYYTTLTDLANYLSDYKEQANFYRLLTNTDFLAIDEMDSRHFSDSDQAQQFFGSSFERIIRYRIQNQLPTLIGSNNTSLSEVFTGQYKRVIDSLLNKNIISVISVGKDIRKS